MSWLIGEEVAFESPERPDDYWHRVTGGGITLSGAEIRATQDHPRGAFVRAMMDEQRQMQQQLHREMRLQEAAAMQDAMRQRQYMERQREQLYRRRMRERALPRDYEAYFRQVGEE